MVTACMHVWWLELSACWGRMMKQTNQLSRITVAWLSHDLYMVITYHLMIPPNSVVCSVHGTRSRKRKLHQKARTQQIMVTLSSEKGPSHPYQVYISSQGTLSLYPTIPKAPHQQLPKKQGRRLRQRRKQRQRQKDWKWWYVCPVMKLSNFCHAAAISMFVQSPDCAAWR